MKNHILTTLIVLFIGLHQLFSATRTASVSGFLNDIATWGGDPAPVDGDDIIINTGITVTLNGSFRTSQGSLTMLGTARLEMNGGNLTVGSLISSSADAVINNSVGTLARFLDVGISTASSTYAGAINDKIRLQKRGSGRLTLTGNSTFTGPVVFVGGNVNRGRILITNPGALGIGPKTVNMVPQIAGTAVLELSGGISVPSNIEIRTSGRNGTRQFLSNVSGDNTWAGDIIINRLGGRYQIESQSGTLTLSGKIEKSILQNREFEFVGAGDINVTGVISEGGTTGVVSIEKLGTGTLTLFAPNTYRGGTKVSGGRLNLGAAGVIPDLSPVTVNPLGTLDLRGFNERVGSIAGTGLIDNTAGTGTYSLRAGQNNFSTLFSGNIMNTVGNLRLAKLGTGTLTLSGNNTYTGSTSVADGTLRMGSATAFPFNTNLEMYGVGVLDLNSFDVSVDDISTSVNTSQITDNSATAGTTTFAVTFLKSQINSLILDGSTRSVAVELTNRNTNVESFNPSSANTFSGGLTLKDGSGLGFGTRLLIRNTPASLGVAGAIVSSPFGTGTIFIGEAATDKAAIYFSPNNSDNTTILNDIVFNTKLGTDVIGAIRCDVINTTFAGTMTANLSDISVSTYIGGSIGFTGLLTGAQGVDFSLTRAPFPGFGDLTVTMDNQTGTINDYMNSTNVLERVTLILNGPAQIPDGSATLVDGTLQMRGNDEVVGSIAGTGIIDNTFGGGRYTLTSGGNNTTTEFSGVIQNTSGTLALLKTGFGTLTLSGNSTFTGDVSFEGGAENRGTIKVTNSNGLGVGVKTVDIPTNNGGSAFIELENNVTIGSNISLTTAGRTGSLGLIIRNNSGSNAWNGNITINAFSGSLYRFQTRSGSNLLIAGAVSKTVADAVTIGFFDSGDVTISGVISDGVGAALNVRSTIGSGATLLLSGANTYTGSTTVNSGIVAIGNATALGTVDAGTVVAVGASIDLNGTNYLLTEPLRISGNGDNGNGVIYNSLASSVATYAGDINMIGNSIIDTDNQIILTGTLSGSGSDLLKNGLNTLTFTNLATVRDLDIASGSLEGNLSTINIERAFTNSGGSFIAQDSEVRFIGTALQVVPDVDFHDIEIVNAAGVNLSATIEANGLVTMTTGIFNTLAFEIDLGADGSLDESNPNTIAPISYITGDVKVTRDLIQNVANSFGNIGVSLTETTQATNPTVITRTTGTGYTGIGNTSILRGFDISPATNTGLNATIEFDFFDHEAVGHTEANLVIYRSEDGGVTWEDRATAVDEANNLLTHTGITAFSIWTASDVIAFPLPITLKSFAATPFASSVKLDWVSASEMNNDFFTVMKSKTGQNWETVGVVKGFGTSDREIAYEMMDDRPYDGVSYYRLSQTDTDGSSTDFDIVSVNVNGGALVQNSSDCQLYPTPANRDNLSLKLDASGSGLYELTILNALGIELHSSDISYNGVSQLLNLTNLPNLGQESFIHIIIKDDQGTVCRQKVIME